MKYPFFASFIVFIIWLSYELKKHRKLGKTAKEDFWEREVAANQVRRKPLDDLLYIHIPYEHLPMDYLSDNEQVADYLSILRSLKDAKIVNLTGFTNTDLKLQYGAPNINLLMEYDENFTILANTLYRWGLFLYQEGAITQARTIFEFAVECRTDVSGTYKILAKYGR